MSKNKYSPRKLEAGDIFPVLRIISKCDIKALESFLEKGKDDGETGVGLWLGFVGIICGGIGKCKDEVIELVAEIYKCEKTEIEKISPAELVELIKNVIEGEEFTDFFTAVLKSFLSGK